MLTDAWDVLTSPDIMNVRPSGDIYTLHVLLKRDFLTVGVPEEPEGGTTRLDRDDKRECRTRVDGVMQVKGSVDGVCVCGVDWGN